MKQWREVGNTAVITGGASGIGLAAAEHLVRDGMNVLIAGRNRDALAKAKAALEGSCRQGAKVAAQVCDVTDPDQLYDLRDEAFDVFGAAHCLMNNAGVGIATGDPWEDLGALRASSSPRRCILASSVQFLAILSVFLRNCFSLARRLDVEPIRLSLRRGLRKG